MTRDDLTTFLAIAESGSLRQAADSLYIGQGTASLRLKRLEEELQVSLFYRHKGIKGVRLTPEGESFLNIAQQWLALWKNAEQLKHMKTYRELHVAAPDTFNNFLLIDVYCSFTKKHPETVLTIQTEHSTEVHQLIENQQMDIGFVSNLHPFSNVVATPFFSEDMVCVCHADSAFANSGNFSDLQSYNEVYSPVSTEYGLWHKQFFPNTGRFRITTGTASMLPYFMEDPDSWTIVPSTIAQLLLAKIPGLVRLPISFSPPRRTAYILLHRYSKPWIRDLTSLLVHDVINHIQKNYQVSLYKKELAQAFPANPLSE